MAPKPKMRLLNWLLLISLALVYFSDQVGARNLKKSPRKFICELPRIRHAEFKIISKRSIIVRCIKNYVLISKSGRRLSDKILKLKCNKKSGKIEGREGARCKRRRRNLSIQNDDPVDNKEKESWISYNAVTAKEADQDIVLLTGEREGAKVAYETAFIEYDDDYIQYDYDGDYDAQTGPGEDYGQFYDYNYDDYEDKEHLPEEEDSTEDISINSEASAGSTFTNQSKSDSSKFSDKYEKVSHENHSEDKKELVKKEAEVGEDITEDDKDFGARDNNDEYNDQDALEEKNDQEKNNIENYDEGENDQDENDYNEINLDENDHDKTNLQENDHDKTDLQENDHVENYQSGNEQDMHYKNVNNQDEYDQDENGQDEYDQDENDQDGYDQDKNDRDGYDQDKNDEDENDQDENDQDKTDLDEYDKDKKDFDEHVEDENTESHKAEHDQDQNKNIESKDHESADDYQTNQDKEERDENDDKEEDRGEYDEEEESSDYDYDEEEEEEKEEQDPETEQLYRSYEILSEFYKRHFVDLRVLDASCDPSEVPPPKIHHGTVQQYLTSDNILLPGERYHEVIYECDEGFKLTEGMLGHMFCQQAGWMGVEPYCEEDPDSKSSISTESPRGETPG